MRQDEPLPLQHRQCNVDRTLNTHDPLPKGTRLFILWGDLIAGCQDTERGHWEDEARHFTDLHGLRISNLPLISLVCSHENFLLVPPRSFEILGNLAPR